MTISSRTTVAIHALTMLARNREELLSSEAIASSVNSNPVVIRRVLGKLREVSVVRSIEGYGGGWRLARKPEEITLYDVYAAVEKDPLFSMYANPPNLECIVARNLQCILEVEFSEAERAMEERLARTTIADTLKNVLRRAGNEGRSHTGELSS